MRTRFLPLLLSTILGFSSAGDVPIPFQLLQEGDQKKVREVVNHPSLTLEVAEVAFTSRPEIYEYLLDHPDFAASVARALKLAEYRILKKGEGTYWLDDARGLTGHFRYLYAGSGRRIFFAKGVYRKKLLPPISGRIVLVLEFEHHLDRSGRSSVKNRLLGYLKIDNFLIDLAFRLLKPFISRTLDRKIARAFRVAEEVSTKADANLSTFLQRLEKSREVGREELMRFRRVLGLGGEREP